MRFKELGPCSEAPALLVSEDLAPALDSPHALSRCTHAEGDIVKSPGVGAPRVGPLCVTTWGHNGLEGRVLACEKTSQWTAKRNEPWGQGSEPPHTERTPQGRRADLREVTVSDGHHRGFQKDAEPAFGLRDGGRNGTHGERQIALQMGGNRANRRGRRTVPGTQEGGSLL